ncbi:peptide-methionine (R)-S-oxide reductase MsrB [Neolewinella aurantiaca]|uniref:peptide-methionine (R)-S-oxide reductase n=1 Tax=Neolewinella aurantiaca TaxID=2602767 RepID=A0A5C7FKS3_9BACT|nr:peptide-methionine (R)-S-oxide reductase MsrB [Neolewinella aurantiaca]TXF85425.1 peptide-methionine (R)-S-oxide reductase MsrB [Neolewinella aurantiaca]
MRLLSLFLICFLIGASACNSQSKIQTSTSEVKATVNDATPDYKYNPPAEEGVIEKIEQPESYWKEVLSPQAYNVLREDGTERSFTSPLNDEKRAGIFTCAACGLPLFASGTKFKSGTGWPSFYEPINNAYVQQDVDNRYGMRRVEVSCARCGGHQGHVFPDGPKPTGLRYCINGVALNFVPMEDFPQAGKQ